MSDNNHGRHKKILDWSDERANDDPIMVTLVYGFAYQDNDVDDAALHVKGFETVKDAMSAVRAAKPCTCNRCRAGAPVRKSLPPTHPAIRGASKAVRKANAELRRREREQQ